MTRRRKAKHFRYSAGTKGKNRVRVFARSNGLLYMETFPVTGRRVVALGHRDEGLARAQADERAAELRREDPSARRGDISLSELFDNYLREVTPGKADQQQAFDRRSCSLLLEAIAGSKQARSLSEADALGFTEHRIARGDLRRGPKGERRQAPVRPRSWRRELGFLKTVLRWGVKRGFVAGYPGVLEFRDRTRVEVRQPVLSEAEYRHMLQAASDMGPYEYLMVLLAHETGHRIGSIRQLRWSDIDTEKPEIRWRPELDKIGYKHETPVSSTAVAALRRCRAQQGAIGEAWVFPAPKSPGEAASKSLARSIWRRLERRAGIKHTPGLGWHSLRRKFATDLKGQPISDVVAAGGWKDASTLLRHYQKPDLTTMRAVLDARAISTAGPIRRTAEGTAED